MARGRLVTVRGSVISNRMQKTIVVAITHRKLHRLYRKYTTVTKKAPRVNPFRAHSGAFPAPFRARPIEPRPAAEPAVRGSNRGSA